VSKKIPSPRTGQPDVSPLPSSLGYHRVQNDNGTFNIMCLDCLRTVAWSLEASDMAGVEASHMCPEKVLLLLMSPSASC
jgi:hypothetical protein